MRGSRLRAGTPLEETLPRPRRGAAWPPRSSPRGRSGGRSRARAARSACPATPGRSASTSTRTVSRRSMPRRSPMRCSASATFTRRTASGSSSSSGASGRAAWRRSSAEASRTGPRPAHDRIPPGRGGDVAGTPPESRHPFEEYSGRQCLSCRRPRPAGRVSPAARHRRALHARRFAGLGQDDGLGSRGQRARRDPAGPLRHRGRSGARGGASAGRGDRAVDPDRGGVGPGH